MENTSTQIASVKVVSIDLDWNYPVASNLDKLKNCVRNIHSTLVQERPQYNFRLIGTGTSGLMIMQALFYVNPNLYTGLLVQTKNESTHRSIVSSLNTEASLIWDNTLDVVVDDLVSTGLTIKRLSERLQDFSSIPTDPTVFVAQVSKGQVSEMKTYFPNLKLVITNN